MIKNRKARHDFFILETEVAGMVLMGSEVRPLRESHASISEAYIYIDADKKEAWIKGMYVKNNINNVYSHDEYRDRKLLLTKKQIKKWSEKIEQQGLTIIPLMVFINEKNKFKMEISLAKGKKLWDKRDSLKEKDQKKQSDIDLKNF